MNTEGSTPFEARVTARWQRIPRRVRIALLVAVVGGASFSATILPFIVANRTTTTVAIAGHLPTTGAVSAPTSFDVAADNTGDGNVQPLCVKVTTDPPVSRLTAVFQGLDHVNGSGGVVCGGELSGSETVSVHLNFTPTTVGATTLRVVAAEGDREIGPARQGLLVVGVRAG